MPNLLTSLSMSRLQLLGRHHSDYHQIIIIRSEIRVWCVKSAECPFYGNTHASREAWEWMGSTIQLLHSVTSTCLLSEPAVAVLDQDQDLLQDPGSCTTQSGIWYRCCCPHHIQHCLTHSLLSLFPFLSFQLCKSRELKINSPSLPADLVRSSLPELGSGW